MHTPLSIQNREELIQLLIGFIESKGIPVSQGSIDNKVFLDGIFIDKGKLVWDPEKLLYPGDLIHEAGHIAVLPGAERENISGHMTQNRPGTEGEEMAVLLWSWAAVKEMGIDPQIIFHEHGYKGQSSWLIEQFSEGNFIGLPLLVWMGMTKDPKTSEGGFPNMLQWLRS
jgi:hypothetical protein